MDQEQPIKNLENAMEQMAASCWRFQGRINALEIFASLAVFDRANLEPNPFKWVQDYAQNMGKMLKSLIPDVDDRSKGEQSWRERPALKLPRSKPLDARAVMKHLQP
jgi:hypothetical protein